MAKRILIINTGGTLSAVMKEEGLAPGLASSEMKAELEAVAGGSELSFTDLCAVDSANVFPEDWASLAVRIAEEAVRYDGIVVIHGTDTLAYTSSMLSFMLRNIGIPVVITGSQLSIAHPVADAMENCRCAIYMASRGYPGVFVAFNRKVMLGCRASKIRTLDFDAFESVNYPNVAEISSLGMAVNRAALRPKKSLFRVQPDYSDSVFLLKLYPGLRRSALRAIAEQGYRGLYIEAFGLGGIPFLGDDLAAGVGELVAGGMTVLVGTQCRYEGSNLNVYETGRRTLETGVLEAFDMTTEAAVTKLMWVLGQTADPREIREYFSLNLCGEVTIPGE